MGGKSTTSTQSVSIPPEVMARYNAVNARAEDVASRPFMAYSQDPNAFVAALTPSQRAGIENINAAAGMSQPSYAAGQSMVLGGLGQGAPLVQAGLGQGSGLVGAGYGQGQALMNKALDVGTRLGTGAEGAIGAGMGPVNAEQFSGSQIDKYMSPYLKNVVEAQQALQQQEAAQQRSALTGQAIMSGAFGGDRGGIAQANLARQQSLANQATLANLLQGGYGQALGAFQQQQGVNLQAGQANRAAMQNAANQLAALGQQQYAQQMGAGQNAYQMGLGAGQALYGMNTGAGQQLFNMANQAGQAYAGLGGQAEQAALNAAQAQMAAGQIQQQTDQAAKTAMYNQFLQQQGYPYQQAQFLGNLAMGTGALSGSTTTSTQPSGWSDRRLKENIRKVGKTYDGQPIYAYNFKGDGIAQLGLMAQDVEKNHPEAVGESKGYKTVDYKKATEDAADRGRFATGGLVPSSMGGVVNPSHEREGFEYGGDTGVYYPTQAPAPAAAPDYSSQISKLYATNLGRVAAPAEIANWNNAITSGGMTFDRVQNEIANSAEAKAYAPKAANMMPTGIPDKPYQEALTYKPEAFAKPAPLVRNESGFFAAPVNSSYSSFATPPMATGKGPAPGSTAPMATGKGPASTPAPAASMAATPQYTGKGPAAPTAPMAMTPQSSPVPNEVLARYGSAQQASQSGQVPNTFTQSQSAAQSAMGAPATPTAPASVPSEVLARYGSAQQASQYGQTPAANMPSQSAAQGSMGAPTATGKGPRPAGFAHGGRTEMNNGGIAALMQLAAQHAAQYGQMPGGPGTERIKHTLQQPSREAIRDFRSSGAAPKAATFGSTIGEAAQMGKNIGSLYDAGEKAYKFVAGGKDEKGNTTPSLRERLSAPSKDGTVGGTTTTTVKPGASLDTNSDIKVAGGKIDPSDWSFDKTGGEMPIAGGKGPTIEAAHGGRIYRYAGGRAGYRGGGLPEGLTLGEGIDIPDEKSDAKLGGGSGGSGGGGGKGGGGIGDAIGTAASVASLATTAAKIIPAVLSMFSDERVKYNKEPIGELHDGQKVYRYDLGDGHTRIGLMAQEVEKRYPHAVHEVDGIKMVDYDKAVSKAKHRPNKYGGGELGVNQEVDPEEKALAVARLAAEAPVEKPMDKPAPVMLASRGDTATDAPMPGLAAVRDATPAPAGLIPLVGGGNNREVIEEPKVEVAGLGAVGTSPNFQRALDRTFKEEGELNKRDTNGEPSLYGINRKYHPDFFNNPSKEAAAKIYKTQYWDAIGADNMSPELAHVAFDTAVIAGVAQAKNLIAKAGGDPAKLLDLRKQFQDDLITADLQKPLERRKGYADYTGAWNRRINNLRNDIGAMATGDEPGQTTQTSDLAEGTRTQARTPGLAGPGLGPMDKKSAPYLNLLERAGGESLPDELKSSAFWRPLLAGVGTMLASNKPFFTQALGEGLAGAVAASGGEEERAQLLGASRANVEKVVSDIVGSSFKTENGVTFIKIIKPDGNYDWFPYNEWLAADPDKRPKVDPRVESVVNSFTRATAGSKAPSKAGATGTTGGTTTDTTTTDTTTTGGSRARPAIPGTVVPRTPAGLPTVVALSKDQASAAARAAFEMAGSDAATRKRAEEVDYFDPQQKIATGARTQQQVLVPLAGSFAALPSSGSISTSGKAQDYLQPFMASLNNYAAILGKPDLIQDPKILMNQNEINKLVNQLQQGRLNDAQLRAVSAFRELAEGIPSLSTSPGGQYALTAKLLSANQREIDKDAIFADWQAAGRGDRGQFRDYARLTSREANRAFDNTYTDAFYAAERQSLERMFKDKAPDPRTGKPMAVIEYLSKYAGQLDDEAKTKIKEAYGPGILRYFGVPN